MKYFKRIFIFIFRDMAVVFGLSKKLIVALGIIFVTPEDHELAERTVGWLYSCWPVDFVFSKQGVEKL